MVITLLNGTASRFLATLAIACAPTALAPTPQANRAENERIVETVPIANLVSDPKLYIGKNIKVCGELDMVTSDDKRMVSIRNGDVVRTVLIDARLPSEVDGRNLVCSAGIWRHVKGLTRADIEARGWDTTISHGPNPDYVLSN